MSQWEIQKLIVTNNIPEWYDPLVGGNFGSLIEEKTQGFNNKDDAPVVSHFHIYTKSIDLKTNQRTIVVKIPNAKAAEILNTKLNAKDLPLFDKNDVAKLEKEFDCSKLATTKTLLQILNEVNLFTRGTKLTIAHFFCYKLYLDAEADKAMKRSNASNNNNSNNNKENQQDPSPTAFENYPTVQKFLAETFGDKPTEARIPSLASLCLNKLGSFWNTIPKKAETNLPQDLQEKIPADFKR